MDSNFNPIPKSGLREYEGYTWDFKAIAEQLWRVTKVGGVVVWVIDNPTVDGSESLASCYQKIYFRQLGFRIHDTIIYDKNGFRYPHPNRYHQVFEYMFVFSKGKPKTFNPINDRKTKWAVSRKSFLKRELDGTWTRRKGKKAPAGMPARRYNIWRYATGGGSTNDKYAFEHPAIFPEKLAYDHILSWSNPGDTVLDPFVGSGTTCKIAKQLGRKWIGIDISEKYVELAKKRVLWANPPLFTE